MRNQITPWVQKEFTGVRLGDKRLNQRLQQIVSALAQRPVDPWPEVFGDWAALKGAYRFFAHPSVESEALLEPHKKATWVRAQVAQQMHQRLLAIQDSTAFNYSAFSSIEGTGPLSTEGQKARGFWAHHIFLVNEVGLPLGLVWWRDWVRSEERRRETAEARRQRAPEEKESWRWIQGAQEVEAAARKAGVEVVHVGDRENDIFLYLAWADKEKAQVLIRAGQNRRVEDAQARRLWDAASTGTVAGWLKVQVKPRGEKAGRVAKVQVRYRRVKIKPPQHLHDQYEPVVVWVVEAREIDPPSEEERLHWLLLTTVAVKRSEEALERVGWYGLRWGIEVYHRVLKSGCKVEQRRLKTVKRLERLLALCRVVAWRILWMMYIGREESEIPCTVVLSPEECEALQIHRRAQAVKRGRTVAKNEPKPTAAQAIRWVARLGGYLGRKGDGPPGPTTLWRGWIRLQDLTAMYLALRNLPPPP
jgi:hypothetical protein